MTRHLCCLAAFAALASPLAAAAQLRAPRTVVAIHWGREEFPATRVVNASIREVLLADPNLPVEFFTEYLESDLFPDEGSAALRDYIARKYRERRIDLVIAIADPALRFVLEHHDELFPGAAVVYSGVGTPETIGGKPDVPVAAVMRGVAYSETLKLALDLHPSTEHVFVVARGQDARTVDSVRASLTEFSGRVAVTYINEDTVPKLLVAVRSVPARSVILYIWHSEQGAGRVLAADEVASLVAQVSPVPVYGTNDAYIGLGVVGGVARRTDETAARLGEMARQILGGTPAEDIPDENARLVPIIDWRQVRRWGIDASRLPADADIRFRQLTAWESYRAYIVATVVVVAAQCLLIAALLTQRARRRRAENTLRIREATLRISYERIRQLAGRLINAQEEARADIARDLHDDVCQELVGVSMALNGLMRSTGQTQDAPTQEALTSLQQRALGIIEGVRRLSHELHPATLRLVGLAVALRAHCVEVEKRHDVQVSFQADDDLRDLHADIALCLFRIAQEALRNSAVHGESRRITVSIVKSGDAVELSVSDDGRGFNLEAVRRGGRGLGLVSIEERAHALGGEVQIVSRPQQGTSIRVRIHVGARARSEKDDEDVPVRMLTPQLVPTSTERS